MVTRRLFALGAGAGLLGGALGRVESPSAADAWSDDLGREITRIESGLKARLGVAVLDTATGQRASHRGGERFPMCSTFKTLACGAVLKRLDAGEEDLSRRIRFVAGDVVTYSPVTKDRDDAWRALRGRHDPERQHHRQPHPESLGRAARRHPVRTIAG